MPLYEYACGACGVVSEISHRLSEPSPTECPACGKPSLSKQISAAGFRLKGEGWYETDFKSKGQRNLAGDAAKESKSDNGGSGKSEGSTTSSASEGKSSASAESSSSKPAASKTSDSKPAA